MKILDFQSIKTSNQPNLTNFWSLSYGFVSQLALRIYFRFGSVAGCCGDASNSPDEKYENVVFF